MGDDARMISVLYGLCGGLLSGMAVLVLARRPGSALHRQFAYVSLALLAWISTLFLFHRSESDSAVLLLGRLNFAAALPAVTLGYLLVRTLAGRVSSRNAVLVVETIIFAAITAFTPYVDQAELLGQGADGRPLTLYGPLFPIYILHVIGFLTATVLTALRGAREAVRPVKDQLYAVALGVMAMGLASMITNVVLPYGFGDFHYTDAGPLSTILFLLCVGYAILQHRLFDLKLFVRKTVVYGLLLTFAVSAYSAVVVLVTDWIAGPSADSLTRFGVLLIAFSFDPLRRFLEQRVDRLLFPVRKPGK
jgi:hypothetical protein